MILQLAAQGFVSAEQTRLGMTKGQIIDEAIARVKALDPSKFIREPKEPKEASADMRARVFFDEPVSIKPEHYKTHIVTMTDEYRSAVFERRSKRMLMK